MPTLLDHGIRVVWDDLRTSVEGTTLLENGTIVCLHSPYGFKASVSFPVFSRRQTRMQTKTIYFETLTALSFYFNFMAEALKTNSAMHLEYIQKNDFLLTYTERKIQLNNCHVSITNGLVFFELQVEDNPRLPFFNLKLLTRFLDFLLTNEDRWRFE